MFIVIAVLFTGIGIGYLLRRRKLRFLPALITGFIWLLLFLLGIEVGINKALINSLSKLGVEAVILTTGAVAGSIFLSWLLWFFIQKSQKPTDV